MRRLRSYAAVSLLALGLAGCPQDVKSLEDPDAGLTSDAGDLGDAGPRPDAGADSCGDDTLDPGETCDGTDLGGASCESLNAGSGNLACTDDCARFDLSGCQACAPQCGARECGLEPVCNSSCGACGQGDACTSDGRCLATCTLGEYACTPDGNGFAACGPNDALGIDDYGPRVACAGGGACTDGEAVPCARSSCANHDVVLLLDRSSRMAHDSAWTWAKDTLLARVARHDQAGRFGAVQFPSAGCSAGPLIAPSAGASETLPATLTAPGAEAATPIHDALTKLGPAFTSGQDAQAVLLVTAGDETCSDPDEAVREAARLFRRGVRVYTIAVTAQANRALLDRLADAGGTGAARRVDDPSQLEAALDAIFSELGACENPVTQVAAGYYHACRLSPDGQVDCWGRTQDMRLVPPLGTYRQIAAGTDNTCAVGTDDQVRCWGRDHRGQSQPPSGGFIEVSGGDSHFCGLRLDGSLACWGYDDAGQASPPAGTYKQVAAGGFHACAIQMDDTVTCWGNRPALPGTYRQIDAGGFGTCGVHLDGALECTGGDPPPSGTFVQVSKGSDHACAIRTDGTLACWGLNHVGQCDAPPGTFVWVSVENEYSCAAHTDGRVECWGNGSNGQTTPP